MDKITADPSSKRFWRNNRRFASIVNAALFHGQPIIKIEDIFEADTNMTNVLKNSNKKYSQVLRDRDIIKKIKNENGKLYLGLECQREKINYLPYKVLLYDSLQYFHQQQIIDHKNDDVEFEFHPVLTLVLYEGDTPWNKATCFSDMLDIPQDFKIYFKDYNVLLVDIKDIKEEWIEDDEVRELIRVLHQAQEVKGVDEYQRILKNSSLTEDAAIYYCALTGIENVSHYLKQITEKGENVTMYRIMEQVISESEERGIEQGLEMALLDSIKNVMTKLKVDIYESMDILDIPMEKRDYFIQMFK